MGKITVSFSTDDADDIAYITAFWECIQSENSTDDTSFVVLENFIRMHEILKGNLDRVYADTKVWDNEMAQRIVKYFPDVDFDDNA